MPVVTAREISRSFDTRRVLDRVSVAIQRGERVGVVGANGSGKSTLGRILAGLEQPDSGEVAQRRGSRIAHLSQHPELIPGHSALDTAVAGLEHWCRARARYERLSTQLARDKATAALIAAQAEAAEELERHGGWDLVHRAEAILGHLGIHDPAVDVGQMSGGERRRVALARVLVSHPDLAVLDEPTNHLDLATIEWLERFLLQDYSGALLLITHDRYILDRVATRTIELSNAQLYSYEGGYEQYLQGKAERMAHEDRAESNRQNLLRTELEWLSRQPKARTTKSQARIARVEAAAAIERPRAEARVELDAVQQRSGKTILELHDLTIRHDGRPLVAGLTLHLGQGERVGIVGPNGCGKTTFLRCIIGERQPDGGRVVRGANTRIAYLEQHRSGLDDNATVFDNVVGERGSVKIGDGELSPRAYLERFLFDYQGQKTRVGALSGGERARVALAKLLAEPSNLLILDEPTNDLDVPTLGALESLLLDYGGTVLVVTHDRYFLDRIATSILAFERDGQVVRHHGTYTTYLAQRRDLDIDPKPPAPIANRASAPSRVAKLSYSEERERKELPDRIDALERSIKDRERELADPNLYATRGPEVGALVSGLEQQRAEVDRLIARWEELETKSDVAGRK